MGPALGRSRVVTREEEEVQDKQYFDLFLLLDLVLKVPSFKAQIFYNLLNTQMCCITHSNTVYIKYLARSLPSIPSNYQGDGHILNVLQITQPN